MCKVFEQLGKQIKGKLSDIQKVLWGVPQLQGSVLGPLLFVLFIDLGQNKFKLCADDSKSIGNTGKHLVT